MNLDLFDYSGTALGSISVTSENENEAVCGDFLPTPAFSVYVTLFKEFEEAVNDQLFTHVDNLDKEIESFGFYVVDPSNGMKKKIFDLQIIIGAGVSFRWAESS